ncbi:MAG: flagellar basal-body rod protein FlgF [Rhodospirillales bacterium]|jgi:flagellar basal-body rod protein FlgF|nr:flagellar basal-body rod protein FlgF [Rhodospirillales bacterium]
MENTSYIALSSQAALRRQMDVVANNLANMSTHGYKSGQMMFVEHLIKSKGGENLLTPNLSYVRDIATMTDTRPGAIEHTGNPLDIAIQGEGFLAVQTPEGERYTRNGRLQLDNTGQLVNQAGQPVLADGGSPVVFAPEDTQIVISKDGTISTNNGQLGKLKVVRFDNEQALSRTSGAQFATTDANPAKPVDKVTILQGAVEGSNVEPILEMASMIEVHRAYDGVKNFIEREDERQRSMIRDLAATS